MTTDYWRNLVYEMMTVTGTTLFITGVCMSLSVPLASIFIVIGIWLFVLGRLVL